MANWRKLSKMSAISAVTAGALVGGSYGIAGAATHRSPSPHILRGKVTAVSADGFTLSESGGTSIDVATSSSTRYFETGSPVSPSGVTVGEEVVVSLVRHHQPRPTTTTTPTTTPASTSTTAPSSTSTTSPSSSSTSSTGSSSATLTSAPTPTAAFVDIIQQAEFGVVSAVSGSTITLSGFHGTSRTIDVTGTTAYYEFGKATTESSVQPGGLVFAWGDPANGAFTATVVDVFPAPPKAAAAHHPVKPKAHAAVFHKPDPRKPVHRGHQPKPPTTTVPVTTTSAPTPPTTTPPPAPAAHPAAIHGVVTAVSGDTITVSGPEGTKTITTTAATRYYSDHAPASASAVAVGDPILAVGTVDPSGTFTASGVDVQTPPPVKPAPQAVQHKSAPRPAPRQYSQPAPAAAPVSHEAPTPAPQPTETHTSGSYGGPATSHPSGAPTSGGFSGGSGHSGGHR